MEAFEDGDARRDVILSTYDLTSSQTSNYFLPEGEDENGLDTPDPEPHVYKWWSDVPNNETRWNVPIFRYAEVILMRAEALNELGQSEAALGLVDQIRTARRPPGARHPMQTPTTRDRSATRSTRSVASSSRSSTSATSTSTVGAILTDRLAPQGIQIDPSKVTPHPITGKPQVLFSDPAERDPEQPERDAEPGLLAPVASSSPGARRRAWPLS